MAQIYLAKADAEIARCFDVIVELRPHLQREDFVERVRRQMQQGFQLAALEVDETVVSAAGFRMAENFAWGRYLYVDDLVTAAAHRSDGWGAKLLLWIADFARQHNRDELHLDSGVTRFGAHRFYLNHRMDITSHHFRLTL